MLFSHRTTARAFLLLLTVGVFAGTANAAVEVPDVTAFPVVGNVTYVDDFGDPRPQGSHEGNDIMSKRHQPAVAFVPGRVKTYIPNPGSPTGTCMLYLHAKNGMTYVYIHLNNDLGLTNDNEGGCGGGVSWPRGINGDWVRRGQLVAFVGDSGDANGIQPHLHFEVRRPSGRAIDPFKFLNRSKRLLFPRPKAGRDVTLTLKRSTVLAKTESTITIRTKRVVVEPLGLSYVNVRKVTFAVQPETSVEREGVSGFSTTDVSSANVGERVKVTTITFTPTWTMQKAQAEAITAAKILLLGS